MNLQQITQQNQDALAIYHEACAVLDQPKELRRARIEAHPQRDRLAAEVTRIHKLRKAQQATQEPTP